MDFQHSSTSDDLTSYPLDLSQYDTHGLCTKYSLRKHKYESEANAGCQEARQDWIQNVGPVNQFGGCNPLNGNFTAVVLPLCKPERLKLLAYILDYAFIYDNIVEVANPENNPALGRKQIEAKMALKLELTDKKCAERVMRVWKEMISTTLRDKDREFRSLEEYVEFRIIDTGAPFVESMMLWGMGMQLTQEEDRQLAPIIQPCFAALGLANDYFSFDREYDEFKQSGRAATNLTNAVWLHMKWHNVDISTAKEMVRQATSKYEQQYLKNCADFRSKRSPISEKLDRYLRTLSYQITGNVVWSLNCPRYHPQFRYDANAGLENVMTSKSFGDDLHSREDTPTMDQEVGHWERSSSSHSLETVSSDGWHSSDNESTVSSATSNASTSERKSSLSDTSLSSRSNNLDEKVVKAPFEYISSMPSKGVREKFVDALNVWFDVPENIISTIKHIAAKLHSASLMLDDIEDGSDLRRGKPATHTVFGTAQTINSANFAIIEAIDEVRKSCGKEAMDVVLGELLELHLGQAYDLYWTRHAACPSEEEYLEMTAKKTGGLFRLIARLMEVHSQSKPSIDISNLVNLIGTYFQIRDDYQNLASAEYTTQKGFCDDLSEGKYSLPLIHALHSHSPPPSPALHELLQQRTASSPSGLSKAQKLVVLEELERVGSMEYTLRTLRRLQGEIEREIGEVERGVGRGENWILRLLVRRLGV